MLMEALFKIAKKAESTQMSISDEWMIHTMQPIHTLEYYVAIKRMKYGYIL